MNRPIGHFSGSGMPPAEFNDRSGMKTACKRKPRPGNDCYLCGARATTADHVPPKCIYPDPKPPNLITVPACGPCNSGNKLHDEYFRWLVATASPESKEAKALVEGKINREFRKRPLLLYRVMKRSCRLPVHTPAGIYLGTQPVFEFDQLRVQAVIEKTVKGLYFHHTGRRLPPDCSVADFILNPRLSTKCLTEICSLPLLDVGDGSVFSYRFIESEHQNGLSIWFLMFFNRVLFITQTESESVDTGGKNSGMPLTPCG